MLLCLPHQLLLSSCNSVALTVGCILEKPGEILIQWGWARPGHQHFLKLPRGILPGQLEDLCTLMPFPLLPQPKPPRLLSCQSLHCLTSPLQLPSLCLSRFRGLGCLPINMSKPLTSFYLPQTSILLQESTMINQVDPTVPDLEHPGFFPTTFPHTSSWRVSTGLTTQMTPGYKSRIKSRDLTSCHQLPL